MMRDPPVYDRNDVTRDQGNNQAIHSVPVPDVFRILSSRPGGITASEAEERLAVHGSNVIREIRGRSLLVRFFANFTHLMALLLWAGGVVGFIAGLPELGIAIWMVNVINGLFSFWQEYRAEKATEALKNLIPYFTRVLREGKEQRVPAADLVPGDVMLLSAGDRISADGRLVDAVELRIDQSTLTGESHAVRKTNEAVLGIDLAYVDLPDLVFAGTTVLAGSGRAVVFATGMETEFGKIACMTQTVEEEHSPLQMEMIVVTRMITLIAVTIGIIFFLLAITLVGVSLAESFIFAMGMVVAFVPEGMLPLVTLSLAMGSQRMARRHALIKRLSAVETLGCTTIICTDKTGTLTQNEMTVRMLWIPGHRISVTGNGYEPAGAFTEGGILLQNPLTDDLRDLLAAGGLCCNARVLAPDAGSTRWSILGDPTEAALKVAGMKAGIDFDREGRITPRLRELPFDSSRKMMSTLHQEEGSFVLYTKGAPREMLSNCTHIIVEGREQNIDDELRMQVMITHDEYARAGLRVLAVARRVFSSNPSNFKPECVEREMTFLGLVAMMDPPRQEVAEAVERCHRAGIRIIMITGDYGLTAESIALRIGLVKGPLTRIITGHELETMDDNILREALEDEVIFARVSPEHKLRVVMLLQGCGHIVAVTGDGVNDAPALKKADIGVAMGISGTDVAKEAADMILTDDNFASIVNAVEEGRGVYANIRKFISYIFTSNTPEAVPFIVWALSRGRIPLALGVMEILAIDLGTDMVPALALGNELPETGLMDTPPRSLSDHLITRSLLLRAYTFLGIIQSIAVMAAFYFQYWMNGYWGTWLDLPSTGTLYESATAMALGAVVATQIGNLFAQRTETASVMKTRWFSNRLIWVGIASELVLIGMMIYIPFFQQVIGTAAFPPVNWLFLFAWTPSLLLADELRKALVRRRMRQRINEPVLVR